MPIAAGIWYRNVNWANGHFWRTDIPTSYLYSARVRAARYALHDGPVVQIPITDLRRALENAPTRENGYKTGPYNIDPFSKRIDHTAVEMTFGPFHDLDYDDINRFHHSGRTTSPRPPVPEEFYTMADIVLDRVRSGRITFDLFVERIKNLNPALTVVRRSDGSVTRQEIAYLLRINYLRAFKNFEEELLS
jgi:hypothetical protein